MYRGAEAITCSIPSKVPEEGGGSRIFCCSPQGEALCSSLILRMFCLISSLYRARVRASSMLSSESGGPERRSAQDIVEEGPVYSG